MGSKEGLIAVNGKRIVFLSNGHGEDQAAAEIIRHLLQLDPHLHITAMPIVGEGLAYRELNTEFIDAGARLPSGGFMRLGPRNLISDLKAGLMAYTFRQISLLKRLREQTDLVVACGDVFLLVMAGLFVKKPVVFYAAAKSEYINGHYTVEKFLMHKLAIKVFTRDEPTARALADSGINAVYLGNPVMAEVKEAAGLGIKNNGDSILGFLPGTRDDAYENISDFLRTIEILDMAEKKDALKFIISFSTFLKPDILRKMLQSRGGWNLGAADNGYYVLKKASINVFLIAGHFEAVLRESDLIIGLSGTGNEQAAGHGKPVVAFPVDRRQYNRRFAAAQKKLLGECLAVVEPDPSAVAKKVLEILGSDCIYRQMAAAGMERMGVKGGAGEISKDILLILTGL